MSPFTRPDSPPPRQPSPDITLVSLPAPPPPTPRRVHSQPKIRVHSPLAPPGLHNSSRRLYNARSCDFHPDAQAVSDDGHTTHIAMRTRTQSVLTPSPSSTARSSPAPSFAGSDCNKRGGFVSIAPSPSSSRTGSPCPVDPNFVPPPPMQHPILAPKPVSPHKPIYLQDMAHVHPRSSVPPPSPPQHRTLKSKASLPSLDKHRGMGAACLRFFGVRISNNKDTRTTPPGL